MQTHTSIKEHADSSSAVPSTERLTIGQLAHMTGINAKAIRYYESIGLLPCPERSVNGYRRYTQADVNRLTLLRRLRLLGVPLATLKPLLAGAPHARCIEVRQELLTLVNARLSALDQEIAELHQLRAHIELYQHQLADCHPDEHEPFSACRDLSCLALIRETMPEEETHEPICCV